MITKENVHKKVITDKAYDILISKSPSERKNFLSNAIIFYDRYLNHTTEVIYEMVRDGEITMDTFKRAVYDLDNIDSKERQEEIDKWVCQIKCVFNCLKIFIQLLDCQNQTAESQSRQGFQPLRAFGSLVRLTIAVQGIYTHYFTLPYK